MGWCEIVIERRDGTRTVEQIGSDPLRDDAPKSQIEKEREEFEDWTKGPKAPDV